MFWNFCHFIFSFHCPSSIIVGLLPISAEVPLLMSNFLIWMIFKVLVFSRGGRSCWTWLWNMPGSDSGARPGWNCGSSSLLLISQSFFILWWEGTGDCINDFCQKFQDFHFAGFTMGSWAPQELITWRITVGNLAVLQVLHRHKVFGDELPGLSVDEVFSPSIYSHHIQEFPKGQLIRRIGSLGVFRTVP